MSVPKLHILTFLFLISQIIYGQDLYQPQPDSVVKLISNDYDDDTLTRHSIEIKKFYKGYLVSSVAIIMSKKMKSNWIDSIVTESYFKKGKPVKTLIRNYNYYECVKYPPYPAGFYMWPGPDGGKASPQPTVYLCPSIYLIEKLHLDSMTVNHYRNLTDTNEVQRHDTLVYCFQNRFFKYYSEYRDTQRITSRKRDYVFDKKGQLSAFINTWYRGDQSWIQEEKVMVQGKDTLIFSQSSIEKRDTLSVHFESQRIYDKHYKQTGYVAFENGQEKYRAVTSYYPDGLLKENYVWRDSVLDQSEKYWWKRSKGRLECWRAQDYKHSSDYSGYYYTLADTSFNQGNKIVRLYGFKIKEEPSLMPVQNTDIKTPHQLLEYDDKGRLLLVKNLDYYSGKLSSVMMYEYWKE